MRQCDQRLPNLKTGVAKRTTTLPVSGSNLGPDLRALVAAGRLADDTKPIGKVAELIVDTARHGDGQPTLLRAAIAGIARIANGLGPISVLLKVMGQGGPNGRYLSLTAVAALFGQRRLPRRMTRTRP
jgi:hypothetical protein